MKKYFIIIFLILVSFGCTQKPAKIIYKNAGVYKPTYSEVYVESPDGKIARSLRGNNDGKKAQEINIINNDRISEINNTYYTVKNGDSLWSISRKYDIKIQELISLNGLSKPYNIRSGQKLKILDYAINKNKQNIINLNNNYIKYISYKVRSGDNLSSIANKYKTSTIEIAKLNNIRKPYNIKIGQNIKIKKNAISNSITKKSKISSYIVRNGDNLSNIAKQKGMSLKEIINLNDLKYPYLIKVGQKLKINSNEPMVIVKNSQNKNKQKINNDNNSKINKKNSFIWPIKGNIVSSFGNKSNGLYNDGINIEALKGTDFKACEDGVVAYVGNELRGYGTIILIKHNSNWISAYAHCDTVKVSRGDKVQKGQTIGTVGNSGNVSTPQLYFSLRNGRKAVDPIKYLEK